ncbi:ferric siderophore ABC transporter substrate-binding protein [Cloacibacterium normanense]|uniref:ferric siderophore ABC transporter substrate-binding protein n=1 Tax=Cloacibacterium normanense TaxID=237258 RepID=UPI0035B11FE4
METITQHKRDERIDKLKSATLTALISALLFLLIFYYQFVREIPKEEKVTTMLINFGDNRNGNGAEEPANQEGSLASADIYIPEELKTPEPQLQEIVETPKAVEKPAEKIITGKSEKTTAVKTEKTEKKSTKSSETTASKSTTSKTSSTSNTTAKNAQGDGQGTAAIGNLIKGRGTKTGTQGTDGTVGNSGDPLGGKGDGDSKIGVDRKLISYIPGTMGKGGEQPSHNCTANGTITISYTVDKAGNVISARRSSGISDPCVVTAAVIWVKKYVKAEKASTNSTGTYKITF